MKSMVWAISAAATLAAFSESHAQTAQEILDAAWEAQVARWEGLDSYVVVQTIMGRDSQQFFVRTSVVDADGDERTMFMPNPNPSYQGGCIDTSAMTDAANDASMASSLSWFLNSAELVGEEAIDGKATWQLRADDIEESQSMNGEEITMDSMTMWLSQDDYLPLKMRIEGSAVMEGQATDVVIESLSSDFRTVKGSQLVEPYRRVMVISGMTVGMDADQIAQAQAQMAEMEAQMASMPEAQRKMMEKMMGPQLETIRKMAEGGGIETEVVVKSITANPEVEGQRVVACEAG